MFSGFFDRHVLTRRVLTTDRKRANNYFILALGDRGDRPYIMLRVAFHQGVDHGALFIVQFQLNGWGGAGYEMRRSSFYCYALRSVRATLCPSSSCLQSVLSLFLRMNCCGHLNATRLVTMLPWCALQRDFTDDDAVGARTSLESDGPRTFLLGI